MPNTGGIPQAPVPADVNTERAGEARVDLADAERIDRTLRRRHFVHLDHRAGDPDHRFTLR